MVTHKLRSLELFSKYGVPSVPYKILAKDKFEHEIKKFLKHHKLTKLMVRTDVNETLYPGAVHRPALNDVTLEEALPKIKAFFEENRIVFIMHPANIYRNFHSLNVMRINNDVFIEVVGPGFIAIDLNRKGWVHEHIKLKLPDLTILERKLMASQEKYKEHIALKLQEVGIEKAKENHSYLLEYDEYVPLSEDELKFILDIYGKLDNVAAELGHTNFVASMSFVDLGNGPEPIFWDLYGLK